MPYDPYAPANPWWQQQHAPQQGALFAQPPPPQQKKEWWQGLPTAKPGQFANRPANSPDDANSPNSPSPGLLQMLMLGGKPTYSGTPTGGGGALSPGGWLGGMFGAPGGGR